MTDGSYEGIVDHIHKQYVKAKREAVTISHNEFARFYQEETGTTKSPRTEARDKIAEAMRNKYQLEMVFGNNAVIIVQDRNFSPITL
jgi:hypothetical protein